MDHKPSGMEGKQTLKCRGTANENRPLNAGALPPPMPVMGNQKRSCLTNDHVTDCKKIPFCTLGKRMSHLCDPVPVNYI